MNTPPSFPAQQWYAVYRSRLLETKPVGLRRLSQNIVLWRDPSGRAVCFPDRCCHRAAQLSHGRVREGCLECPYHGMRYDGDGRVVKVPALGSKPVPVALRLAPLVVREARGLVWLWHGRAEDAAAAPLPWDDALDAELAAGAHAADIEDRFDDLSWLRVMENSTDLFHVPFVHRRTVPIGEVLEDFTCHAEGPHIRVSGRMTDGKSAGFSATVHVVAPSVLVMTFGARVRFLAIATPIDETHTWLFARYVQDYVRLPLVGRFMSWLLGAFDYRLLQRWQDAPVWRTQELAHPADVSHYQLIVGDGGVACYFRALKRMTREGGGEVGGSDDRDGGEGDRAHRGPPLPILAAGE